MPPIRRRRRPSARPDTPTLLRLYEDMLRIRLAEERIVALYPSDKIQSPIHLSIGQEAVSAGVCRALGPADHLYGTYRGHGAYIARGGHLGKLFAELYGKDAGCSRGKGGSMHLVAPEVGLIGCSAIVANAIPVAAGDALAAKRLGQHRVVAALFGDGALGAGGFYETVNFAVLKGLPLLFVLENNGYAVHSKVEERHKQTELWRVAEGLGLPGARFDGNDAGAVYAATRAAAAAARRGAGPRLLEFMTYRWSEHVGPGSDLDEAYRRPRERALARRHDPLRRAEEELRRRAGVSSQALDALRDKISREIDAAVAFAEQSPFPGPDRLLADLFA